MFCSTLIKHELITKWSNPCKYNITDKGIELASRIVTIENQFGKFIHTSCSRCYKSFERVKIVSKYCNLASKSQIIFWPKGTFTDSVSHHKER